MRMVEKKMHRGKYIYMCVETFHMFVAKLANITNSIVNSLAEQDN